jgi:hypothetical protein
MPQTDPFIAGLPGAAQPPPITETSPPPSNDPFITGLSKAPTPAPAPSPTITSTTADPFITGLTSKARPETGQEEPTSMLGKAWNWANTPLINLNPENKSGFLGGTEDVLSGLTSPLSIGLTLATFGGGAALRGLGLAAEEMPVALRGAQALLSAGVGAEAPEAITALRAAGFAEKELPTAIKGAGALFKAGVTGDNAAVLNNLVKSSPFLMKSLADVGIKQEAMPVVIRGVKSLIDAGFTVQNAWQVVKESPRVLDALKEGRYDDAARLATHVVAGGALTLLGTHQLYRDAGPLWEDVQVQVGGKVRMSDTNRQLRDGYGRNQREIQMGKDTARAYMEKSRKDFPLDKLHADASGYLMHAGVDSPGTATTLIDWHNSLARALGKEEEVLPGGKPVFSLGKPGEGSFGETSQNYPILKDGKPFGVISLAKNEKTAIVLGFGDTPETIINPETGKGALSNKIGLSGIRDLLRQFKKENPEVENVSGLRVGGAKVGELRDEQTFPIDKILGTSEPKQARYDELISQQLAKAKYSPEEARYLLDSYKEAIKAAQDPNNPTSQQMFGNARMHRDTLSKLFEVAQSHGLVKKAFDNYLTNYWKPEEMDSPSTNLLRDDIGTGRFKTNISMGRHRVFENPFEGQLLGRKLRTADPTTITSNYIDQMTEAIANRNFQEYVLDHVKASDGRPLAALAGSGKQVTDEDGNPIVLTNAKNIRNVHIPDAEVESMKKSGILDRFLNNDVIVKTSHESGDKYAWSAHDYLDIPTNALQDWNYAAHGPDGTPVMVKSHYKIHPEGKEYLQKLLNADVSPIRQMKPLNWLLKTSTEAKHIMLSFSPFHLAQEGLRAAMTGISPLHWSHLDINEHPDLKLGVEEGLTRGADHNMLAKYEPGLEEGLGGRSKLIDWAGKQGEKLGIIGKPLAVLRDVQNYTTEFLFEKYIPGLKDRAFMRLNERWAAKLADDNFFNKLQENHEEFRGLTKERAAARLAAAETNERFGGINYKMLGRAVGTQDFLRLMTLAPDWLESEIRALKRTMDPTGGVMLRRDLVRLTAGLWATSRLLNMLVSGKMHNEAPFGVAWTDADGKEKIYSIRTLPTDMFHAVTDPAGFMKGRLSPGMRATTEAISGRDFQGRKLTPADTAVDIVRNNFVPIPAQAIFKGVTGGSPDLTTPDQAVKAAGLTAQVYRSEAQKLANTLSANRNETGPVDESQLAKHRAIINLENQIRSGQAPITTLNDLVEQGHMSVKEAKQVQKNVQETQGMDPEMANFYTRASRLPMPEFLKIWDAATPNEQAVLTKLLIKKRTTYNSRIMKELTPAERASDPTYNRLKTMFPGAPVF